MIKAYLIGNCTVNSVFVLIIAAYGIKLYRNMKIRLSKEAQIRCFLSAVALSMRIAFCYY